MKEGDYMASENRTVHFTGMPSHTAVGSVTAHAWYDFTAAASYLGISVDKLRNRHRSGTGPSYIKPSHKSVLFTRDALDAWLAGWQKFERN
jgi:Helix-turn-helix domain